MDDPAVAAAINDFLHQFLEDREHGRTADLAAYQAQHPDAAEAIAAEHARLSAPPAASPPTRPDGDDAGPGAIEPLSRMGPYRLLRRLGRGSFGLVYLAEDTRLCRQVALKILARSGLETGRERAHFQREAEIASRLEHPGICAVHDIGRHGIWTWIAMRYVPGETLAELIARSTGGPDPGGPVPVARSIAIIEKAARALHAAHEAGVIHRDVKPANIMVAAGDEPVLLDFGLARTQAPDEPPLTLSGEIMGTPAYMAPEQVDPERGRTDPRTDVWALGATLHELLTLQRPFGGPTQTAIFRAILAEAPPSPRQFNPAVSRDLAVVVATALAKDPADRYPSALALAEDLRRVGGHEPILARPVGPLGRLARWARRSPAVATLLAVVLAVLLAGAAIATFLFARAEATLKDWERLADGRRLEDLLRAAEDDLWPAIPENAPAMEAWLAAARGLVARTEDHRRALEALRRRARPAREPDHPGRTAEDPVAADVEAIEEETAQLRRKLESLDQEPMSESRREASKEKWDRRITELAELRSAVAARQESTAAFAFEDAREQLQHDKLADLVLGLERLSRAPDHPGDPTIPSMVERAAFALSLRQRTIDAHTKAWKDAIARVGQSPVYAGLRLPEIAGLVPLGADPESGLEEFSETSTGTPAVREAGTISVAESTAMVFVLLPGGSFTMGSQSNDRVGPNYDPQSGPDEGPPHPLTLDPFLLSKYEMTQGQWLRVTGMNPSSFRPANPVSRLVADLRHPVEQISWEDARRTLGRLGLAFPTEAQWEYACRAGTTTPWWCPSRSSSAARTSPTSPSGGRTSSRAGGSRNGTTAERDHAPVGSFRPNPFGLHDAIGNVWEWCADASGDYDRVARPKDGLRLVPGVRERIHRGGGWLISSTNARSATRNRFNPTSRSVTLGLRPARAL